MTSLALWWLMNQRPLFHCRTEEIAPNNLQRGVWSSWERSWWRMKMTGVPESLWKWWSQFQSALFFSKGQGELKMRWYWIDHALMKLHEITVSENIRNLIIYIYSVTVYLLSNLVWRGLLQTSQMQPRSRWTWAGSSGKYQRMTNPFSVIFNRLPCLSHIVKSWGRS